MTTAYRRGRRVEYLLKNELEEKGWSVIRSAGSRGTADLIAWRARQVRFIQVKRCRSVPALKRAIKDAIVKFEEAVCWWGMEISFQICLRYKGEWIKLLRLRSCWALGSDHAELLGTTVWSLEGEDLCQNTN